MTAHNNSSAGSDTLREVIAGIVDPDAKFQDLEGVIWSKFEIQRRELAYRKADAILSIIPAPAQAEQVSADQCEYCGKVGGHNEVCVMNEVLQLRAQVAAQPPAAPVETEEFKVQPRGGVEYDWQQWSLIYQRRLRSLMKLIVKEGYAVSSDGDGMPYALSRPEQS